MYITGSTNGDLYGQANSRSYDAFISKFIFNNSPTDISSSSSTFEENIASGSAVAALSTTDPDAGDTHTYALVTGDGDTDNSAFTIDGDQLKIIDSPDFETQSTYSIRKQTTDSGSLNLEKEFTFAVNELEEESNSGNTFVEHAQISINHNW